MSRWSVESMQSPRTIIIFACFSAVIASAALSIATVMKFIELGMFGSDYLIIASNLGKPLSLAYLPDASAPFAYPPTTKLLLWPLSLFQSGYVAFTLVTATAFLATCRKAMPPLALVLVPLSFPFINVALIGQPTFLVVALTIIGLSKKDRRVGGVALALAAGIKPQLLTLVPFYLLVSRDWRAFVWAGAAYFALVVGSVLAFGYEAWQLWLPALANYRDVIAGGDVMRWVITPIGVAERDGFPVWIAALYCICTALALPFIKYRDPVEALFGLSLGALLVLPYGCPDNALGLVPLLARNIARGKLVEIIPFSMILPKFAILVCLLPIGRIIAKMSDKASSDPIRHEMPLPPN